MYRELPDSAFAHNLRQSKSTERTKALWNHGALFAMLKATVKVPLICTLVILRCRTRLSVLSKNRLFFSGLAYCPYVPCQCKRSPKTHLLKSALQSVENAVLLYSCHCGLMKTKVFENDDVTASDTSKCACSHQVWCCLQSLLLFRVDGLKWFKTATCGHRFFWKRRQNGYVWTGPKWKALLTIMLT